MLAFLIDPETKTITAVNHTGGLQSLYNLLQADVVYAVGITDSTDAIYYNDELPDEFEGGVFRYKGVNCNIMGLGLVVGTDEDGSDTDAKHTLETLTAAIEYLGIQDFEPEIEVTGWN